MDSYRYIKSKKLGRMNNITFEEVLSCKKCHWITSRFLCGKHDGGYFNK